MKVNFDNTPFNYNNKNNYCYILFLLYNINLNYIFNKMEKDNPK
jgi:hypothetical protein